MNKYLLSVLLSIQLNAQVDPELKPYVLNFEKYFGVKVDTKVVFGDVQLYTNKKNAVGVAPRGKNLVIIDKKKFYRNSNNKFYRYYIIYHELGHAFLDMRHTKEGIMKHNTERDDYFDGFKRTWRYKSWYDTFISGRKIMKEQYAKK